MSDSPPPSTPATKNRGCLFFAIWGLLAAMLIFCAGVALTLWWIQRPVKPVELSAGERNEVQLKIERIQEPESRYAAGEKRLTFTERELNGLLNEHTNYGDKLKFEIDPDAVNAYWIIKVPQDSPFLAGRTIRMRGRVNVIYDPANPQLRLEDISIYNISIPDAWLGEIKNRNLVGDLFGQPSADGMALLKGIKTLRLKRGALEIELAE